MTAHHRLYCFSVLKLNSPLHVGSGETRDPFSDQPVLRDVQGIPFIPGGTIAGAFGARLSPKQRARWMEGRLDKYDANKHYPSNMVLDDAYPLPNQRGVLSWPVEIRSANTLVRDTLTAKKDHFFQSEVIPVGCKFCFSCRCDFVDIVEMAAFKEALRLFLSTEPALGSKQNAGQGRLTVEEIGWKELDFSCKHHLKEWLVSGHGYQWNGNWKGLEGYFNISREKLAPRSFEKWRMTLGLEIENGLHLSSGSTGLPEKEKPDQTQAQRTVMDDQGNISLEYVDYGATIKGRLRTVMEMLLRTYLNKNDVAPSTCCNLVSADPAPEEKWGDQWPELADFFGYGKGKTGGKKGAWQVEEAPWNTGNDEGETNDPLFPQDHIRLCEITQQVIGGAKFDFAPLSRGASEVVVSLHNPLEWQKSLVYYAGKLLVLNVLPWGGCASRGYLGATVRSMRIEGLPPDPQCFMDWIKMTAKLFCSKKEQ